MAAIAAVALVPAAGAGTAYAGSCNLGPDGSIHHVIYIQYDNTHLRRDNPNVPSDLEQVPALKDYLTGNGTLLSNDHTILISHTAGGIVSALTGLYPDRNGIGVSNSYGVFKPDGSIDQFGAPAFTYWTDPATVLDPLPNLITDGQKNTPAPWAPFTRAGCDTGAFSIANMELENTSTTASGDITKVFGSGSPEFNFAKSAAPSGQKTTDFEGIAIHCSQASSAAGQLCGPAHGGKADVLPDEPGGYTGFNALFGAPYANQVVDQPGGFKASTADANGTATGYNDLAPAVNDVFDFSHTATPATCSVAPDPGSCPASQPIGSGGVNGFPGFSPTAAQTLGYTAAMQESGIPVTFAYIEDSHDNQEHTGACPTNFNSNGPGTACYVQQLRDQNTAYRAFFNRLAADGINKTNTMFVFTVDEGDHFAGGPPLNPSCDGVTVACTYAPGTVGPNTVGEIDTNLNQLVTQETGDTTPFDIHFDDAPTVYVPDSPNGPPGPTNPKVRQLEREMSGLTITSPRTGNVDQVTQHIADHTTQGILHMENTDPLRNPSFTLFGNDEYFFQSSCAAGSVATQPGCPVVGNGFAWNHGDDNPEISDTWIGMVGPDIQHLGQTAGVWTDHTDLRPTLLKALGLHDDYPSDGDVVSQVVAPSALPPTIAANAAAYQTLEAAQKQLDAPFGQFGHDAETVSTTAVATTSVPTYSAWDAQLAECRTVRDAVDARLQSALSAAAAGTGSIGAATAGSLDAQAAAVIGDMHSLAAQTSPPAAAVCDAPAVTITSHPSDPSTARSAGFAFSTTDPANPSAPLTTSCSLDGAPAKPCTSPVVYSRLADGPHTFSVQASDQAGNVGTASFTFTVDATPPTCTPTGRLPHGPAHQVRIRVQDVGTGLQSIGDIRATNGSVSVAPFTPGTTSPVVVTVTKTHATPLSNLVFDLTGLSLGLTRWSFDAADVAGNVQRCADLFF